MTSLPEFDLSYRPDTYFDQSPDLTGDLPDYLPGEVEVAWTQWTKAIHGEIVSIRARPDGDRIRYRVVDEYDHRFDLPEDLISTELPLTMGECVRLLNEVRTEFPVDGLVEQVWEFHRADCATPPDEMRGFIDVGSSFYPLGEWYEMRFELWFQQATTRS